MTKITDAIEFLRESNNIEDEWDDVSLEQAIYAWEYIIKQKELTVGNILKTHKILALKSNLKPDEKGYFRKQAVYVGGREGKPFYAIDTLIHNWCERMNVDKHIDKEKQLHVEYEKIHPFIDFNGRTGRIFLNWYRVQLGEPLLVIKQAEKQFYYNWFNESKTNTVTR